MMQEYFDAWKIVIILFLAGLISAAIVYYAIQIIDYISTRNDPSEEERSWLRFLAWPLAFITWVIVDYLLYPYVRSLF
jgi:hypothetical protein